MTTRRTAMQDKALGWFVQKHELAPITSAHPTYYFRNRAGEQVSYSIITIMNEYLGARDSEKRERGRTRR